MLIISDTNILSSFAAGEALELLFRLFPDKTIYIPPAVHQELSAGLTRGQAYLETVLQSLGSDKLRILHLSKKEQQLAKGLPNKLNTGEREAIALSKCRKGRLLSHDKQAIRYCRQNDINVLDLPLLLRLLWKRNIVLQTEINTILAKMKDVENLQLSQHALRLIFTP